MSQENVEVVRLMLAAWNAGDMEGVRELWHPEAIVRPAAGWPEPGPFVGREAVMQSFEQLRDAWEADTLEATDDIIDIADRVVVGLAWRAAGHGPELDMRVTQIFTVRKGRILGMESFWNHEEALEAVGLEE
jgi:uncharacterized protein